MFDRKIVRPNIYPEDSPNPYLEGGMIVLGRTKDQWMKTGQSIVRLISRIRQNDGLPASSEIEYDSAPGTADFVPITHCALRAEDTGEIPIIRGDRI